ncbi:MAG: DUF3656 domain-containing protein [Opitutaceae bacterium]
MDTDVLREQLGRLGGSGFELADLANELDGDLFMPVRELNELRRRLVDEVVATLDAREGAEAAARARSPITARDHLARIAALRSLTRKGAPAPAERLSLAVLCRTIPQIEAALESAVDATLGLEHHLKPFTSGWI